MSERKKQKTSVEDSTTLIYYDKQGNEKTIPFLNIIDIYSKPLSEQRSSLEDIGFTIKQTNEYNAENFKLYLDTNDMFNLNRVFLKPSISSQKDRKSTRRDFYLFINKYFKSKEPNMCLVGLLKANNGPNLIKEMIKNHFFAYETLGTEIRQLYSEIVSTTEFFKYNKKNNFDIIEEIYNINANVNSLTDPQKNYKNREHHSSKESLIDRICYVNKAGNIDRMGSYDIGIAEGLKLVDIYMSKQYEILEQLECLGKGDLTSILIGYGGVRNLFSLILKLLATYHYCLLCKASGYNKHNLLEEVIITFRNHTINLIKSFPPLIIVNFLERAFHNVSPYYLKELSGDIITKGLCKKVEEFNGLDINWSSPSVIKPIPSLKKIFLEIEKFDNFAKMLYEREKANTDNIPSISKTLKTCIINPHLSWNSKRLILLQYHKSESRGYFDILPFDIIKYIFKLIKEELFNLPLTFENFYPK